MRTTSIISIIRKYGLSSKRLNTKNRIKYEDAIKGLKGYESAELKIADIIDNTLTPRRSVSHKCQIPGCNHNIRYEYILENKMSGDRIVAGSTCVWPTLGFSELEKKEFKRFEKALKDYHDMLTWKEENKDVVDKLMKLKEADMKYYKAFWKEIESCRLTDEDTEFIRSLNVDDLIRRRNEKARKVEELRRMTVEQRKKKEEEYEKILEGLQKLLKRCPDSRFYKSLDNSVKAGYRLSDRQIACIKNDCNKVWYEDNIKGTDKDIIKECDNILKPILMKYGYRGNNDEESIRRVNESISSEDNTMRLAWSLYKVKYRLAI